MSDFSLKVVSACTKINAMKKSTEIATSSEMITARKRGMRRLQFFLPRHVSVSMSGVRR